MRAHAASAQPSRNELRPRPIVCLSRGIVAWTVCQREHELMRRRYQDAAEHSREQREARRGR